MKFIKGFILTVALALSFSVFAKSQEKCRVHGQRGYAYFSKNFAVYEETAAKDKKIYLLAYKRGKNGYFGNNKRIPALIVEKKK